MVLINNCKILLARYPLLRQLAWFGIIGTCAAIVNMTTVILIVELIELPPLLANIIGFILAFNVSYFGHRCYTFAGTQVAHHLAIPRLFLIAGLNFTTNEGLYYLFLRYTHLSYFVSLLCVIAILPALTFVLSKIWVFGNGWFVTKKT